MSRQRFLIYGGFYKPTIIYSDNGTTNDAKHMKTKRCMASFIQLYYASQGDSRKQNSRTKAKGRYVW